MPLWSLPIVLSTMNMARSVVAMSAYDIIQALALMVLSPWALRCLSSSRNITALLYPGRRRSRRNLGRGRRGRRLAHLGIEERLELFFHDARHFAFRERHQALNHQLADQYLFLAAGLKLARHRQEDEVGAERPVKRCHHRDGHARADLGGVVQ